MVIPDENYLDELPENDSKSFADDDDDDPLAPFSHPCSCRQPIKLTKPQQQQAGKNATTRTLGYKEAPNYLKFNPYITSGYRGPLNLRQCINRSAQTLLLPMHYKRESLLVKPPMQPVLVDERDCEHLESPRWIRLLSRYRIREERNEQRTSR
jgi:hypothetical protein